MIIIYKKEGNIPTFFISWIKLSLLLFKACKVYPWQKSFFMHGILSNFARQPHNII